MNARMLADVDSDAARAPLSRGRTRRPVRGGAELVHRGIAAQPGGPADPVAQTAQLGAGDHGCSPFHRII